MSAHGAMRSVPLLARWAVSFLWGTCGLAGSAWSQPRVAGSYYVAGDTVGVDVVLDRVGVIAWSAVPESTFRAYVLDSLGLSTLESYPDGIHIVSLGDTLTRDEVVLSARLLGNRRPGIIADAGFVATRPTGTTPTIVTDEFIVLFRPHVTQATIDSMNTAHRVRVFDRHRAAGKQFVLQVDVRSRLDAMEMANLYFESGLTVFAHPDFVRIVENRSDPLVTNQWHLDNDAQGGGTADADVDALEAWGIARGSGTVVAVIDGGVDLTHEDLPELWVNPGETPGDQADNDQNDFEDDVNGWDFHDCDSGPLTQCGDYTHASPTIHWVTAINGTRSVPLAMDWHGTPVAGLVASREGNQTGGAGVCPECKVMPLRRGIYERSHIRAFDYATANGADVINCSWGFLWGSLTSDGLPAAIDRAATQGRSGKGCVVVFAMSDESRNDCAPSDPDISSHPRVIAVSASTDQDQKTQSSAYGSCTDVLGPSYCGKQWIVTTDISGTEGYNSDRKNANPPDCPPPNTCPAPSPSLPSGVTPENYAFCFMGTSAAAPIVAGVAALVLAAETGLERAEVQRLLQDTADKTEPSVAVYDPNTGFSQGASTSPAAPTHGFGRVNAYEAVHVAAPTPAGLGGVDVFLRDNELDWGNTEQWSNVTFEPVRGFLAHWKSPDIKIDAPAAGAPVFQPAPTNSATFLALTDERPIPGMTNKVYVRVRNRGPRPASPVTVSLHWTHFGTALEPLPDNFWTASPWDAYDTSHWHPIGKVTLSQPLQYSGSTAARGWTGDPADQAQIAEFAFPAPMREPGTPNHYCVLAVVDAPGDLPLPLRVPNASKLADVLTPSDNNITHRNIQLAETASSSSMMQAFFMSNPTGRLLKTRLKVDAVPRRWRVRLKGATLNRSFELRPLERRLVQIRVDRGRDPGAGEVTVIQEEVLKGGQSRPMGGVTLRMGAYPRAK